MKRTATIIVCACVACARPMAPPGGERDQEPPRVVSTTPEHRAIVAGFDKEVVFAFDETLSEKGATQDAVIVSPETGRATLERDGSDLKVRIEGGWKRDQVYRVVIRPGIQDRFGNARREPAEVVFSTGPELVPTAIAGVVTDRLTDRPLADTRVIALSVRDSVRHVTVTDTSGFFGLRFLPLGRYEIVAFEDRNRNGLPDRTERRGDRSVLVTTVRDTVPVELAILAPDTTPARLTRAEARDSMEVRLFFDDYLDPEQSPGDIVATLLGPDSVRIGVGRLFTPREYERLQRARADSAIRARDTTATRPPALPVTPADTATRILPTQELVFIPPRPLAPRTRYRVEVTNVRNIRGLPGGYGSVAFTTRAPATAPPADSSRIRRDTLGYRHE